MATMNMLVRNTNSVIVHGNTLSMETFGDHRTHRTALGGVIRSLGAATARLMLTTTVATVAAKQTPEPSAPPAEQSARPD
jgi:hypothetical protein